MGEPVRIHDLAVRMIELSGFNVANDLAQREGDIEIQEIGLRPGEKLHEELLIGSAATETSHPKIKVASEGYMKSAEFNSLLQSLGDAIFTYDAAAARDLLEPHFCHLGSRSKHPDSWSRHRKFPHFCQLKIELLPGCQSPADMRIG